MFDSSQRGVFKPSQCATNVGSLQKKKNRIGGTVCRALSADVVQGRMGTV